MTDHADEQLLRSWLGEPVWLPESDLGHVTAYTHVTPQQRGPLPRLDRRGVSRVFAATRLLLAAVVMTLFGGLFLSVGLPSGREGDSRPAAIAPTGMPIDAPAAVAGPTVPPEAEATAPGRPRNVHWEDQGVTFAARDFVIESNGRTFRPGRPIWIDGHHDPTTGPPREAAIEAHWQDQDTFMRLAFDLRSDGTDWWIDRLRAYDGTDEPEYLFYGGLEEQTRTPVGEPFKGSLDVEATRGQRKRLIPDARIRVSDMRLEAFDPASIPSPEPRTERPRMIVDYELSSMLPGQSQRISAKWCLGDDCWPASEAKWRTRTPKTVRLEPTTGGWTRVTALQPGAADVSLRAPRYGYSGGFEVHPRPGAGTDAERHGTAERGRKVLVTPRDAVLRLGQYVVLTGWRCSTKGAAQLDPAGEAGTEDDGCATEDLLRVRPLPNSGMAEVGTFGPSAVLLADSFEVTDDDIQFAAVFVTFRQDAGATIAQPNLYIEDAAWAGPPLGDLDADGDVDAADREMVASVLDAHGGEIGQETGGWDDGLDINGDHRIDSVDLDIVDALVRVHAGELVPSPAEPFATEPPEFAGMLATAQPTPVTQAPQESPES